MKDLDDPDWKPSLNLCKHADITNSFNKDDTLVNKIQILFEKRNVDITIFNSCIVPVITFGSHTWALRKEDKENSSDTK